MFSIYLAAAAAASTGRVDETAIIKALWAIVLSIDHVAQRSRLACDEEHGESAHKMRQTRPVQARQLTHLRLSTDMQHPVSRRVGRRRSG